MENVGKKPSPSVWIISVAIRYVALESSKELNHFIETKSNTPTAISPIFRDEVS